MWVKESGYIYRIGTARIYFLSAAPTSNIVGATANLLLETDEAQDVLESKYDKEVAPMAASTNATKVFWGTAWTSQTLLAREKAAALELEKQDGVQRVFEITADQVRQEVPAYGKFVDEQIARLGRGHPFIKTQFFSETIDANSGMFPADRIRQMSGEHNRQTVPQPNHLYAFCVDVAGETPGDETSPSRVEHDSTALTIFEIDLSTLDHPMIQRPSYKVVERQQWTGAGQSNLFNTISGYTNQWQPRYIVVDATGIGEGLASFLDKAYPGKVIPFKFSLSSKSELGWNFIALIESGRYKEPAHLYPGAWPLQDLFYRQCEYTQAKSYPAQTASSAGQSPNPSETPRRANISTTTWYVQQH